MMIRLLMLSCVVVIVASCAPIAKETGSSRSNPDEVLNKTWLWVSTVTPVERISVDHPERYTIHFSANGKLQVKFDCNSGGGGYTLADGKLSFGPLISTRMACPEGSQDAAFMRDLQRVASYFLKDGMLFLELPLDSGTMQFRRTP